MRKPDTEAERRLARAALLQARAAIDEALRELDGQPPTELRKGSGSIGELNPGVSMLRAHSGDTPMTLEDLDVTVLEEVIASLPPVFDTYHVVEHPVFRAAHVDLLERPALNQLAGKVLRRNAPVLRLAYRGPRGRRRSALWQRQEL